MKQRLPSQLQDQNQNSPSSNACFKLVPQNGVWLWLGEPDGALSAPARLLSHGSGTAAHSVITRCGCSVQIDPP